MKRTWTITGILMLAATTAATAQRGRDFGRAFAGRGLPASPNLLIYQPERLLRNQTRLDLTEDQVETLRGLENERATAREQARTRYASHLAQMREVLAADQLDAQAVRDHFDAAQAARSELAWLEIDGALRARAVLTEEQRTAARESRVTRGRPDRPGRRPALRSRRWRRR